MERSRGIQRGMKKVATVLFLMAALASTGCGQNALMNPTADDVLSGETTASQSGHEVNPAGHEVNP